ncbi:MAG TPA: hypothetical protein VGM67_09160 [Gemmatimonadaceae bacterium]|jgi:hypothetical protein
MSERWRRWMTPAIALLALASSVDGINNWFTYDDRYIVELNPAMHSLHRLWMVFASSYWPKAWGGDGYRPFTILAYRLESAIGGGIPVYFHAINILLYMLSAILVFFVARRMLPEWAAWITAALFAVHPVHVEAVAGIVGQAELTVAVAVLAALNLYLRDRMGDRARGTLQPRTAATIVLLYAVACLSKEHGIVLPALFVAAELTVIDDAAPGRERYLALRPFYLVLTAVAIAFVGVRSLVLSDHGIGGFQPFTPFNTLHISGPDRVLTALGVVPEWLRLFFWPAHLASEYGPPGIQIAQGLGVWQLPGFMLLVATVGLCLALRRRKPAISFGIAFVCIVLLPSSNFIIPAGIVLAERTLFLPSVGAMIVLGGVITVALEWLRIRDRLTPSIVRLAVAMCALVLATGAVRSWQRTLVWKNNETLFERAVVDAPLAYRAHYMLGAWDFENKRKRLGEAEYHKALVLFPYDPYLSYSLAEQYRLVGLCNAALPLYEWSHKLQPNFTMGLGSYAWCLLNADRFDEAKVEAFAGMRAGENIRSMRQIIHIADSAKAVAMGSATSSSAHTGVVAGRASNLPDSVQKAVRHRTGSANR